MPDLVEEARKRKERIAALRLAKQNAAAGIRGNGIKRRAEDGDAEERPSSLSSFRNYTPAAAGNDRENQGSKVAAGGDGDKVVPEVGFIAQVQAIEKKVEQFAKEALNSDTQSKEVDLFNLAPKKPDWDLKRELEKKLEKLERKTATCIATIIRERLKSQGEVTDLGGTVDASNAGAGGDESGDEA